MIEYVFNHHPNINGVVHCAGHSSINDNNSDPLSGAESNLKSMVSLLDTLVKHKVGRHYHSLILPVSVCLFTDGVFMFSIYSLGCEASLHVHFRCLWTT